MEQSSPRGFLFRKPSLISEDVSSGQQQQHSSLETTDSLLAPPVLSRSPRSSATFDRPRQPPAYEPSPRNLQSEIARRQNWNSWQPDSNNLQQQYFNEIQQRQDVNGLQPRDPSADILVLRVHSMTNIAPLRLPPSTYTIIPCAEIGDRSGEAMAHLPIGRFRADPDVMAPGYFAAKVNSDVLRLYAGPNTLFYFKIQEQSETRNDMFGMVTLSGLPENILSDPTVLPEQVINRPEFRLIYPIDGIDGNTRGELTLSALYDFSRPGEYPWPHPESQISKVQLQNRMKIVAAAKPFTPPPPLLQPPSRGRRLVRHRTPTIGETLLEDLKSFCMTLPDTFC